MLTDMQRHSVGVCYSSMRLNTDNKQRLTTAALFCLEFYKVLMGAFLTVFVPRTCDDHTCTLVENIYDNDTLHIAALGTNAATFALFLALYYTELKRENWCIRNLDMDDEKPADNLDDEIEAYPELKLQMKGLNARYAGLQKACSAITIGNVGVSIADIASHWAGAATVTPLLSYTLLVAMKLANVQKISSSSLKDERAYSAFMTGPRTYNTIDDDVRVVELPDEESKVASPDEVDVTVTASETV